MYLSIYVYICIVPSGVHEVDRCMGWKKGVCIMATAAAASKGCKNDADADVDATVVDTTTSTEGNACSMG